MVSRASSNPFHRHGLDHLSPSSLNTYASEKGFWCLKYLFGFRDSGPAMWRGLAVEAGFDEFLFRGTNDSSRRSLDRFDLEACGLCDDATLRERDKVPGMLARACADAAAHGLQSEPILRQFPVEYWFEGIEVPVIGVIDYEWEDFGVDLKTTGRMPTQIPDGHGRQVSLYRAARNKPYKLYYVTESKSSLREITDEQAKGYLKQLEWQAHAIRRVLSMFPEKHDVAQIFVPDFDHFYWKSEESRIAAAEVWK